MYKYLNQLQSSHQSFLCSRRKIISNQVSFNLFTTGEDENLKAKCLTFDKIIQYMANSRNFKRTITILWN